MLGVEVVGVELDGFEMTAIAQQECTAGNRLPEELVEVEAERISGFDSL